MKSGAFRDFIDHLLGRGRSAVTVPPLDGAFKPNNRLEEAAIGLPAAAPDNLVQCAGRVLYSSGTRVRQIDFGGAGSAHVEQEMGGTILALAASPSGRLVVATDTDGLSIQEHWDGPRRLMASGQAPSSPEWRNVTALAFADDQTLLVCIGSTRHRGNDWPRDLLTGGRSGAVWRLDMASGAATLIADGLAYPNGIALARDGSLIVSESWEKRLIQLTPDGRMQAQPLEDLPGYPGRLSPSGRGGYWLCIFAPRNQLIEFVLREPVYRRAMMQEVDPELWIAPALSSGKSVLEPMQGGALKQMGILKPWAPTRSYGLIVELGDCLVPIQSLHSRTGGRRHGVTSALEHDGSLWVTAKGGDELLGLALT